MRITLAPSPTWTSVRVVSGPTTASRATVVVPCSWVLGSRRTSSSRVTVASIQVVAGSTTVTPARIQASTVRRLCSAPRAESCTRSLAPFDLPAVFGDDGGDAAAGGAGQGQHVGEVLLALGVVGGDVGQRVAQHGGVEGVDAGVDLADVAFGVRGVLVFADAGDGSVRGAEDAAVAGGVVQDGGEDGDGVAVRLVGGDQFGEQLPGEERDVAVGDHDGSAERRRWASSASRAASTARPVPGTSSWSTIRASGSRAAMCEATRSRSCRTTRASCLRADGAGGGERVARRASGRRFRGGSWGYGTSSGYRHLQLGR